MATSLASQLQAIKSVIKGTQDPIRAPRTRPSVIFDPKEAADIDLRTIFPIALSGLEVLIENDARFGRYKGTLFSETSVDLDREKMVPDENEKLNKSIHSFLRLLSGHLQLPAALKTMEYLIRRYQVHVFNMDELVLCVLPYHDTHTFVLIVQLLDLRSSKWAFLDGVKTTGAPPPRNVLVQQCIRDKGLLEALCNYASPTKEFQHSRTTICFCTAVVVESLGAIPKLDTDIVQRVSGFVFDGLNPAMKGDRDHKAGALMIVGILATRATLSTKLVQNLIFFIARIAQHDTIKSIDLPWLRVLTMAMITLVQSQSAQTFPKKTLMILKELRDFTGVLSDLSHEFNIQMFLSLYLESLVDYSMSDDSFRSTLIIMIEALPLTNFIEKIVLKMLLHCAKFSQATDNTKLHQAGQWAKEILVVIERHYPFELRDAIRKFLENSKADLRKESVLEMMFDGNMDMPMEISNSKVWFSLEHPKAVVRQSAISKLAASSILQNMTANPQKIARVEDAMVRGLYDEDLGVVQTALSIDGLDGLVSPSRLLKAYGDVLSRCIDTINKSASKVSRACDVAVSCLNHMVMEFQLHHLEYSKDVARIIFPLLLVHPMSWRVNLKALELAKSVQWAFYIQSSVGHDPIISDEMKNLDSDRAASINMKTIGALAEVFFANPQEHVHWLVECSNCSGLSKSLFFLIILQAMMIHNKRFGEIVKLYQSCSLALKNEWNKMELQGGINLNEDINVEKLDQFCMGLANHLLRSEAESLNAKIIICIFWTLLKAFNAAANESILADDGEGEPILKDLFLFFITAQPRNVFTNHLQFLLINCTEEPFRFLSKYFSEEGFPVEVQVESLRLLATVCSIYSLSERSSLGGNSCLQLLSGFPSLLIPLSHEDRDIRTSALSCIEGLYIIWRRFEVSPLRNGNDPTVSCLRLPTFGDFLESLVNQKELISSDVKFLRTCVTSMLSSSSDDLLLPVTINDRFDQLTKDNLLHFILRSALKFSSYGKLMVLSLLKGIGNIIFHEKGTKKLLLKLLDRRSQCKPGAADLHEKLSTLDIETLCLLLEVSLSASNAADLDIEILDSLLKALRVDVLSSEDLCVVRPCITVIQNLKPTFYDSLKTEIQDKFFGNLVFLFHNDNGDIRDATRDLLLQININCSTVIRLIEVILGQGHSTDSSKRMKGEDMTYGRFGLYQNSFDRIEEPFFILVSLLDILCLKKKMGKRKTLIQPLFRVLSELFSDCWLIKLSEQGAKGSGEESEVSESVCGAVHQAQQTTLLILKDITDSLEDPPVKEGLFNKANVDLLVECASSVKDLATRNNAFLLLSSIARVSPDQISGNIMDIFTVIGVSALKQNDSYSQHVLEDLISTLVPCWLSKTNSMEKLLQIFIKALPDVAEHRRLTLIVYLLRTLGEQESLGILIVHLIHSLVNRLMESSPEQQRNLQDLFLSHSGTITEWEYTFALQICNQYSCKIWFPCLVKLLEELRTHNEREGLFLELHLAMHFILFKLQDTELIFELESVQYVEQYQITLRALLEQVIFHLQLASVRSRQLRIPADVVKQYKDCANQVLKTITRCMTPSTFFQSITQLLDHASGSVKRKVLGLLSDSLKDNGLVQKKQKEGRKLKPKSVAFPRHLDETATPSFNKLCLKVAQLINNTTGDLETALRVSAISSLEVLTKEFPSDNFIYCTCLTSIVENISCDNLAISSAIIRATGSLISVLGSKALSQLPLVMKHMLQKAHEVSTCPNQRYMHASSNIPNGVTDNSTSLLLSILIMLEAIVDKLGGFLNPYLEDILDLVVLHPEYASASDTKINLRAANVRKLLTEKIPVRLILTPLLRIYSNATKSGESSLCLSFEMLASLVGVMDKSSIGTYHVKVFEHCLIALDLRHQLPEFKNVDIVERSIIHAIVVLTMKLTESMFKPLFLHSLEWAESEFEGNQSMSSRSLDRAISFYKLVNILAEKHRSLFVPYFKYFLDDSVRYLSPDSELVGLKRKKKKAKVDDAHDHGNDEVLSPKQWHLRALVLKSLYQCYLYDTNLKFLDSSNFQVLLKPIVSQLVVEPPASLEPFMGVPTVEEVDETLVMCLGQMAITARSDVLWKPLNHEVLMQVRDGKVRTKMVGLRVVKYLVEHLKEEYLILLPETIPFLAELLEDVELPVKTLSQEILKELETLSGESLRQYL